MSKTLLCHISTPAALKCFSMAELTKPQNVLLFGWAATGKLIKVASEVTQDVKTAEDFVYGLP